MSRINNINNYIRKFNVKHDLEVTWQFINLIEEIGELARCLLEYYGHKVSGKESNKDDIAEEIADILFVVISIADLLKINWRKELEETCEENIEK